ncbi:MAG: hypothetical protein LOD85_06360 [Clostridia bacterium]|jgi:hypothetical protein|nr:hypothetical protein [Bacillota bacterium]MBO2520768.1 hypothetical protein [Bacillota bacterium]
MARVTEKELGCIEELLRLESALYEKFHHYAAHAAEDATRKLCQQLGDRSREHLNALLACLEQPDARIH